jgi:hypothetical protein
MQALVSTATTTLGPMSKQAMVLDAQRLGKFCSTFRFDVLE